MKNTTNQTTAPVILASGSPRRKELLEQAGIVFSIHPSDIDEGNIAVTEPEKYVKHLAEAKAKDISVRYPDSWVLGADTVVVSDGMILGKPGSKEEALSMMEQLSGKIHIVYTGFCISLNKENVLVSDAVKTFVEFKVLSKKEINWYASTPEPYDKAGGYAIQGKGAFIVKRIEGSYTNVVGLPVCEVIEKMVSLGALPDYFST